jgi:hypothetical protein
MRKSVRHSKIVLNQKIGHGAFDNEFLDSFN